MRMNARAVGRADRPDAVPSETVGPAPSPAARRDGVTVQVITAQQVTSHPVDELTALLADPGNLVWVDIASCDAAALACLSEVFRFHSIAVHDCVHRNHMAKLHVYDDHVFSVVHAPEIGSRGHVHYIELDQFMGANYLVTVHGPLNPVVDPAVAFIDTDHVRQRLTNGHLRPRTPFELTSAIISSITRREVEMIAELAQTSGALERQLMMDEVSADPEPFLDELFKAWYELLAIRTIATHSASVYRRMFKLVRSLPATEQPLVNDIAERFEQVVDMADGQREFLHGVIEFFQTRTSTHMTVAAEELNATSVQQNDDMRKISAWVAIVAVPTGVTGFFGQNVPYPGFGTAAGFYASLLIMIMLAGILYAIFRHKRWL